MDKNSKIYIAGHKGMVGSAISRGLHEKGYTKIIGRTIEELDLTNQQAVADFFENEKPDYVVLAAAKVGGIMANDTYRAQFIYENLMIEANVIHQAYLHGVKKLLFLGSSCIYPKNAPQPLKEEYLLTGALEQTNEPYAIAKIAGIKMCESYYRQYGCNFISVMPTNLYGPNDNYNLETSHVLPAIIRKMHLSRCFETANWDGISKDLAKRPITGINENSSKEEILNTMKKFGIQIETNDNSADPVTRHASRVTRHASPVTTPVTLTLWGTGQVFREFMHVNDMAAACIKIMEEINMDDLVTRHPSRVTAFINIGTGKDQTIAEIAALAGKVVGFTGNIRWDSTKPDGALKKLMDTGRLRALGVSEFIPLKEGIRMVYDQYLSQNQ
ncbi:MAG: GDP-L-fucose synthase [Bacteroidales bacterium]|nr:GDP-L-fucose synthase [Bacteroidales bacterium]